jgi:phage major head subunit gpT-like protein
VLDVSFALPRRWIANANYADVAQALEEQGITVDALAEGSEEEFKNRRHLYGVTAIRNVGYGYWQHGCLVQAI